MPGAATRSVTLSPRPERNERATVSAGWLDAYLNAHLRRVPGLGGVTIYAGYRLSSPDADGCNWSGTVTPIADARAPSTELIDAALMPIVQNARARFNLSE